MKQKKLILISGLFFSYLAFGQLNEKNYYDENWEVCKQLNAKYYRIYESYDSINKVWKVKGFYINGNPQWIGTVKNNDPNSTDCFTAKCHGKSIWFNENGVKSEEGNFYNGELNGLAIYYHKNGKLYRKFNFVNGEMKDVFFIECDEFGKCQNVFYEIFSTHGDLNKWELITSEKDYKSSIIPMKGLLMETKTDKGFKQTIYVPLSLTEDFSIETIIDFISGDLNSGHGIIWGFKDWNDYYYTVSTI